ncbi:hypothetical protein HDU98_009884 [Podochytrium sp. JEL0797]|nr:hypothetical protein HDU98_009884 [Podochytrium sp. JEL0797]
MGKTVAIIGAGPAGIVAAIALKRQGFEPTLYDKLDPSKEIEEAAKAGNTPAIEFGDVGGSISLYSNGLKALENVGLLDTVEQLRMNNVGAKEMVFMLMDGTDRIVRNNWKTGELEPLHVFRSAFHGLLLRSASAMGIRIFAKKQIQDLQQTSDAVKVTFQDGTVVKADFVVGADGIHSTTRRLVFPDALKPVFYGAGHIGVLESGVQADGVLAEYDDAMGLYMDPVNGRTVYASRCGHNKGSFSVVEMDRTKALDKADDWRPCSDLPTESARLADLTREWGVSENVATCIKYAKRITPLNFYDVPDLETFSSGRVVLIGDAAHGTVPFYGQGLNQAMEDAGALGDLFGHFGEDGYQQVFELFDRIRIPRVRTCSAVSRQTAERMNASSETAMRVGRFFMRLKFGITNLFSLNDGIYFHDYREDVKKAVPDIQLK